MGCGHWPLYREARNSGKLQRSRSACGPGQQVPGEMSRRRSAGVEGESGAPTIKRRVREVAAGSDTPQRECWVAGEPARMVTWGCRRASRSSGCVACEQRRDQKTRESAVANVAASGSMVRRRAPSWHVLTGRTPS